MPSPLQIAIALLVAFAAAGPLLADRVELADGSVLEVVSVDRDGALYLLRFGEGKVIALPADLVKSVRLEPKAEAAEDEAEPTEAPLADLDTIPAVEDPRDEPVLQPSTSPGRQLTAFGDEASRFPSAPVDSDWQASGEWNEKGYLETMTPSRLKRGPVEPFWTPATGYGADSDALLDRLPSRWSSSPIQPHWRPVDGTTVQEESPEEPPAPAARSDDDS